MENCNARHIHFLPAFRQPGHRQAYSRTTQEAAAALGGLLRPRVHSAGRAEEKLGIKAAPTASLARALADMLERTGQKDKAAKVGRDYGLEPAKTKPAQP
jgi:hypothetical protein